MENEPYRNDSITEVLLEIRLVPGKPFDASHLQNAFTSLVEEYPKQTPLVDLKTQISLGQPAGAKTDATVIGVACFSVEEKRKIEARQDGITFGRLAPYPGWEVFRSEARHIWDIYRPSVEPNEMVQISLRYVNRFNFPSDSSFEKYFNLLPLLPGEMIGRQEGFFMQTRWVWDELQATALVNQTTIDSGKPDLASVIIDIGVTRTSEIGKSDEELWGLIEEFRAVKNQIFESVITDTTREMLRQ